MGTTKNVDMSSQEVKVKKVLAPKESATTKQTEQQQTEDQPSSPTSKPNKPKPTRTRSKKYIAVKSKVDRTRKYDVLSAVELVKQLSYSKFTGTLSANLKVKNTDVTAEVTLPHTAGKLRQVTVVDDQVLKDIGAGKIEFDILVSSPEFMPKLTKHAKILGPKGLMPNPKNGTLTANPAQAVKELSAGKQILKTEKKQAVIHVPIGKADTDTKHLIENLQALMNALKGKVEHLVLSSTMGPGVKVDLESI